MDLKEKIEGYVNLRVKEFGGKTSISYRDPKVGYSSALNPLFKELKKVAHPNHLTPKEILGNAETVINFTIPLSLRAVNENIRGNIGSYQWAYEYAYTNVLINFLAREISQLLARKGFKGVPIAATWNWDEKTLFADWSHRHSAYISGLGKFGVNNLLITEMGTAVRLGTVITDAEITPSFFPTEEYCLSKRGIKCDICLKRCPVHAFENWGGEGKWKCYENCLKTDEKHRERIGYVVDCCGKCISDTPCATSIPKPEKKKLV